MSLHGTRPNHDQIRAAIARALNTPPRRWTPADDIDTDTDPALGYTREELDKWADAFASEDFYGRTE